MFKDVERAQYHERRAPSVPHYEPQHLQYAYCKTPWRTNGKDPIVELPDVKRLCPPFTGKIRCKDVHFMPTGSDT
jgi:hypothetical protein